MLRWQSPGHSRVPALSLGALHAAIADEEGGGEPGTEPGDAAPPGEDIEAYASPFDTPARAPAASEDGASRGRLLAQVSGRLGGATALVSSVASGVKDGTAKEWMGGAGKGLWEKTSNVRSKLSAVTADVASSMKEEVAGVASGLSAVTGAVSALAR